MVLFVMVLLYCKWCGSHGIGLSCVAHDVIGSSIVAHDGIRSIDFACKSIGRSDVA
jgi:hypothetical protein